MNEDLLETIFAYIEEPYYNCKVPALQLLAESQSSCL